MPAWLVPLLQAIAKPLAEWWQSTGQALLEKLLIYRKGAKDQQRKDEIARLQQEAERASRAQQSAEEVQRARMEKEFGEPSAGDDHLRVRDKQPPKVW